MKIIPVRTKQDITKFYDVARWVYRDNPYWVCPLDSVIEDIFDPKKNVFFQHGSAERWILQDDKGRYIGRVAAFINEKKAYNFDQPTGGLGFFEVVNNKQAAFKLFDTAKAWLQERGMEAVDGPINFGENDNFWGLLVEGFESTPAFGMNYHQPITKIFLKPMALRFISSRSPICWI